MSTSTEQAIAVRLNSNPGIIAVLVDGVGVGETTSLEPPKSLQYAMRKALEIFKTFGCPSGFRVAVDNVADHVDEHSITFSARREGDTNVVVVYGTGHPVSKSIARMIRRAVKSGGKAKAAA